MQLICMLASMWKYAGEQWNERKVCLIHLLGKYVHAFCERYPRLKRVLGWVLRLSTEISDRNSSVPSVEVEGHQIFILPWAEPVAILGDDPHRVFGEFKVANDLQFCKEIVGGHAIVLKPRSGNGSICVFVRPYALVDLGCRAKYEEWLKVAVHQVASVEISTDDYPPEVYDAVKKLDAAAERKETNTEPGFKSFYAPRRPWFSYFPNSASIFSISSDKGKLVKLTPALPYQ